MCLGIPMKIKKKQGDFAWVEAGGVLKQVNIRMISSPKIGEFVIVHAGFAISKIDKQEAQKTLRLVDEIYR